MFSHLIPIHILIMCFYKIHFRALMYLVYCKSAVLNFMSQQNLLLSKLVVMVLLAVLICVLTTDSFLRLDANLIL
jgi:hypothetical protein